MPAPDTPQISKEIVTRALAKTGLLLPANGHDLNKLWQLIEPPASLIGLQRVLANLPEIINMLPQITEESWEQSQIEKIIKLNGRIITLFNQQSDLRQFFSDFTASGDGAAGPFHGYIGKHPLYTALWQQPPDRSDKNIFRQLQAQYLNGVHNIRQLPQKLQTKNRNAIANMSLAIRQMAWQDKALDLLHHLPASPQSATSYLLTLQYLLDSREEDKHLKYIERFLAFALADRRGHNKEQKKVFLPVTTPGYQKDKLYTLTGEDIGLSEAEEANKHGCCPGEATSALALVTDKKPLRTTKGESPGARAAKTLAKFRHVTSLNQHLAGNWDNLNDHEIAAFLSVVSQLYSQLLNHEIIPAKEQKSLAALLSILFWTASPLERALDAIAVMDLEDLPKQLKPETIYIIALQESWVLASLEIAGQGQTTQKDAVFFTTHTDRVQLPFSKTMAWPVIQPLISLKKTISGGKRVFPASHKIKLGQHITKIIAYINRHYQCRITIKRLTSHLFKTMTENCGDEADACLCFGYLPPSGQATHLYYYAPSINHLAGQYQQTVQYIQESITAKQPAQPFINIPPEQQAKRLGSKLCPRAKTVQLFVKDMLARLTFLRRHYIDDDSFFVFHNDFTAYCVMMIGFATGYRAVRDPLSSIYDIDWQSGFVVISDKDDNDHYHARLTWLPKICRQQLKEYLKHRATIPAHLLPLYQQQHQQESQDNSPLFFFIDHALSKKRVRPATLAARLSWTYPLPLNINRHYLRTRLREMKVAPEIINAFMGHWFQGQQPFGRFSTLSPLAFKNDLQVPLTKLLAEAGWQVIAGLGQ